MKASFLTIVTHFLTFSTYHLNRLHKQELLLSQSLPLLHFPLSLEMLLLESRYSTPTALLATLEDRTLSCPTRPSRKRLLSNTSQEDVTRRLS
jgi:hypothetical protein